MTKPTHQRARLLKSSTGFVGMECLVRVGPPISGFGRCVDTNGNPTGPRADYVVYPSNIVCPDGTTYAFPAERTELLARGPEDFAVNPPTIQFADWVASERARLAAERGAAA